MTLIHVKIGKPEYVKPAAGVIHMNIKFNLCLSQFSIVPVRFILLHFIFFKWSFRSSWHSLYINRPLLISAVCEITCTVFEMPSNFNVQPAAISDAK